MLEWVKLGLRLVHDMFAYIYELDQLEVIDKIPVDPSRVDVFDTWFELEYGTKEYDYTYEGIWFFANSRRIIFDTNLIFKKIGLKEYDRYGFI